MSLLSPSDIKKHFVQIFDKIQNTTTKDVSYDLYKKLILKSTFNENQMMYIIQQVNDFLLSFTKTPKEKEHALKLLALTFYQPETLSTIEKQNNKIFQYKYIPSILTIIQSLISDSNSNLFQSLSSSFADIIQLILPTDIEVSYIEMEIDEKRIYEMIQNFCFQNMASDDKANRLMGSMFLTRLVENCPIVLQDHYMQGIWDCLVGYLEKNTFHAKYELLNCLISLILGAEGKFKPYANITLCKVFEFLTDSDWLKRKLALNVIYTIIHYCSDEIYEVKEQLIAFLKLLKGDKVKEVRDICLLILDVLNNKEGEYTVNSKSKKVNNASLNNNRKYNNNDKGLSSSSSNPNFKQVQYVEKNSHNVKSKNRKGSLKKNDITTRQSKINKRNINNSSKEFILVEKHQETSVTSNTNNNVNDISTDNVNITTQKSMESVSVRKRSVTPTRRTTNNVNDDNVVSNDGNELNTSTNRVVHTSGTSLRSNINKVNVNRKEDKTFVNEKMVIKHDPNRSVFKTGKNTAFFNKAKTQPDIVVLDKPKKEDVMYIGEDNNNSSSGGVNNNNNINENDVITNDIEIEIKDNDNKQDEEVDVEKYLIVKQQENDEVKDSGSDNDNDKKILSPTFTNVSDNNNNNTTTKKKGNEATTVYSKKRTNNNINKKHIQQEPYKNHNHNNNTKPPQPNTHNNNNNITTTSNTNSNNGYSVDLINKLLFQMNSLSSKQVLLLDTLDTLQSQTMSEISALNSNLQSLSSTVSSLSTQLSNYQQSNSMSKPSQDTTNEAFKHALNSHNEQPLLDLIKQTPMNKYGDVEITYLEKAILKLISTLSNGNNIKNILSFYKNIILCLKCPLKQSTIQNVKEILEYLLQHNDSYYHLNDDFLVDISLLLSNIDDNNK